jgi:hypothetical protein
MMGSSRTIMPASQDAAVAGQQKARQVWTPEEDQLLSEAVAKGKLDNQTTTSSRLPSLVH